MEGISMPDCINLKRRFGDRYKVVYEEAYYAEYGENAVREAPDYMIIPCRHGHICPWGGENLAACTRRRGPIANRLKALPFVEVAQDGDDGANVVFSVEHFDEVAKIMQARRRPVLSDERRAELAEQMRNINRNRRKNAAKTTRPGVPSDGVVS
jgi:hypothetical protein